MVTSKPPSSLAKLSDEQLQELTNVLWSWPSCEHQKGRDCESPQCPWSRWKRLARFHEHYRTTTAAHEADTADSGTSRTPFKHADLFEVIAALKANPDLPRTELVDFICRSAKSGRRRSAADEALVNVAVKLMVMVNCAAELQPQSLLEHGTGRIPWRDDVSFSQFMTEIFPSTDHPSINEEPYSRAELTAKKLKKHAHLVFRPTDDLNSHLELDRRTGIVKIFHDTAFLKEHLRLTKGLARDTSFSDSLKLGAIPRQIALECLDSIQKILFPLADPKSRALLLSLTTTSSFDPDCLLFESATIRNASEKQISYDYFGTRLADLYEELKNPRPQGLLGKWFERNSAARHLMMATFIGVVIAIMLGMASLAVGGFQAWVAYHEWKHPVD